MGRGVTSASPAATRRLGEGLARKLQAGDVLALTGPVGAGKTVFVQGLARGLQIPEGKVASPSFVLVREYQGRMGLFHADLFRLEGLPEARTVGLEEYYERDGVTVIEWANQVPGILPEEYLEIHFEVVDPRRRRLTLAAHGSRYENREF
ncbi:MAG: tRNA (adenosine(37)-N6)-threonylcarbamoyltransferase complex ATPase subunit type 1 TsaE [Candidatus Omnitrophica bacterium]|nr:tRNA (adenosine(37)-N6)-threonylcarbamoyltransferase complex ATPase subunit type 1 TsaE [Candidatus Omnitrophota bacterium]